MFHKKYIVPHFIRSEENFADSCTKNQPEKLYSITEKALMENSIPLFNQEDVDLSLKSFDSTDTSGRAFGIPTGQTLEQ